MAQLYAGWPGLRYGFPVARESVTLTLPEDTMAKIDYLRGRKTRQVYLAALLTAVIAAAAEEQARQDEKAGSPGEPCKHPPARVHKGLCHSCGCNVSK